MNLLEIEKNMAYILRHAAVLLGYEMDPVGYMKVDDLLKEINNATLKPTLDIVKGIIQNSKKKRFELSEDGIFIRAVQGHSIEGINPEFKKITDEHIQAYHGTTEQALALISQSGFLKSMSRNYIHLSPEKDTAITVGKRYAKGSDVVILVIDLLNLQASGVDVFISSNNVILVKEPIPLEFISILTYVVS